MRIVILTQYYPPESGAPQNRLSDLARRLVGLGHQVTVLTAMPNYPEGRVREPYRGRLTAREEREGVRVVRCWIYATRSRSFVPWLWHYLSFVITSLAVGALRLPRADLLITESPPLFLGISGWILARLKGAGFAMNVADLWPKAGVDLGILTDPFQIRLLEGLETFLYRRCVLVSGQTRGIVEHVAERVPDRPMRLLPNGADVDRFRPGGGDPTLRERFGLEGRFVVGYGGLHGPAQALHTMVDAAARLRDLGRDEPLFALFGEGPEKERLQERARDLGLGNVRFYPLQPSELMPRLIPLWDVGVVTLYDGELMRLARPSKLFEMMASGLPVVLSAPDGEAAAIIRESRAGLTALPEDPDAVARAVLRLVDEPRLREEMADRARRFVEDRYDRQAIAEAFSRELEAVADAQPGETSSTAGPPGR